jgi:hypothetical protein
MQVRHVNTRLHLTTLEVGMVLDLRFCAAAFAPENSGPQRALLLTTVSLERMKTSE